MDPQDETIVKALIEVKQQSEENFEKGISVLAGGTLVLSMTFIEKIVSIGVCESKWTLIAGWIFLALTLLLNLISHQISSRLHGLTIQDFQNGEVETINNLAKRNRIIVGINWATSGLVMTGITFLIIFCSINSYKMQRESQTNQQRPGAPDQTKGMPINLPRGPIQQPVQQPATTPQPSQPTPQPPSTNR